MLIDEYDYFANEHITPDDNRTGAVRSGAYPATEIKCIYSTFKARPVFSKFFITGVSPIVLSHITSGFNIQANVSFDHRLSGLCGLTRDDVKHAFSLLPLKEAAENEAPPPDESTNDKGIGDLANRVNGYHFCDDTTVKSVFNTTTCMEYLQGRFSNPYYQFKDPDHSEVYDTFLKPCTSSPVARTILSQALEQKCDGSYRSLEYEKLQRSFELTSLVSSFHFDIYFVTLTSLDCREISKGTNQRGSHIFSVMEPLWFRRP